MCELVETRKRQVDQEQHQTKEATLVHIIYIWMAVSLSQLTSIGGTQRDDQTDEA